MDAETKAEPVLELKYCCPSLPLVADLRTSPCTVHHVRSAPGDDRYFLSVPAGDLSPPRCPSMADGRQPDEHWSSNGQENGENGYSAYSSAYRENGYHGGAAAHAGTTGRNTYGLFLSALSGSMRVHAALGQWH